MPHNHRLQFSVEESICFQKGQEVSELLSISLDPDIRVQEVNDYVSIKGSLELTGEYNIDHSSHFEELDRELRHVEEVRAREDGTAELIHCFPVDITIPKNKVSHLNDVFVFIDAFDYQLTDSRILTIQADLAIEGLLEESEPKEPEIPLYVAPEFAREEMINLAGHHSEDENEPELMIRHEPEIPLSVSKEAAQETEKNEEETPPLLRQEEEEQEAAPILREREEEEQEAAPILREREEEEQEAAPILREREVEEQEAAPILREQEEEEQEAAPILREREEEEQEAAPILREHKEEEEETAPILREQEEEEKETAPILREQEEEEQETALILREQEEEEQEAAPILREREEEEQEAAPILREREEEERETAPVLREQEEVPKPVSFTEPPPPVSFQHEEEPEEAEEPAIMSAVRNEPVFEDDSAEVQEEPKDDIEKVFPAFTLTPHAEKPKIAEQPFLQKEEQPEAEPLLRQSDHEAAEDEDEPAVFQEEQAPVYREFVPERQEEEFYSAPKLLEEEAHDEEGFEIEVRKMAPPEEETGKPLDLSFQFSKLPPEEPAQAEPPEPLKSERKNEEAAPGTEQKENDNSHYLTKLFTREEEKFSRMKICIVQQQDTIDRVCERYDITSQQLIRTNALSFDDELEEGQLLYIPEYNNSHA
ncbi:MULTISPECIES: LysM peptidoglycan-binding domain-containing protein [Bacillus amyloliquefaciens group]|uniref:LysM peptidoglycan-binding domain-containing protein n=1 Tax=Bacillus amyloliquefaciens group TaxID=1938374 RepID=UPI00057BF9D8|nr:MULTISPECIES: LysM peptidoglycan-binding domain-containing protein [Bacillus amyloliquefaciens group]AKF75802.1 peptidoglycan-binding protein [Bacillus velezensis]MEB3984725.1 LysM peptidoglycan-binding domain-containing protein [Bacillus velezensis]POR15836.1 peptidoglycan-binding protein [Bacillus velezensis]QCE19230.1 peptidoglycan-binding protein [Bacillus velezensis]UFK55942.1 LysM peptidoglycan-binding domain-containing protein [Bacillus amyloliquefaciens]